MRVLITGVAGFIGMHMAKKLLLKKNKVLGIDNINNYYSTKLKKDRVKILRNYKNFQFHRIDLKNKKKLDFCFKNFKPDIVINFAAQAGVRYSLKFPEKYINSNIIGFFNIIELASKYKIKHFVYASSSSVYGLRDVKKLNSENDVTDTPLSIYAVTKKTNENIAYTKSYLKNLPTTGVRFFTVYGPWGRPDMALFKFTDKILNNKKIEVYNNGKMNRSFTYIDDAIKILEKIIHKIPKKTSKNRVPFNIVNLGSKKTINLINFIKAIEKCLKKKSIKRYLPLQDGDSISTKANTKKIKLLFGLEPTTKINVGINKFIEWYKKYYKIA